MTAENAKILTDAIDALEVYIIDLVGENPITVEVPLTVPPVPEKRMFETWFVIRFGRVSGGGRRLTLDERGAYACPGACKPRQFLRDAPLGIKAQFLRDGMGKTVVFLTQRERERYESGLDGAVDEAKKLLKELGE